MLTALGLCWFIGAVGVPAWKVRSVVEEAATYRHEPGEIVLRELGGAEKTAEYLHLYVRLPRFIAPRRALVAGLLGQCGKNAVPALLRLAADDDHEVRVEAVMALGYMEGNVRAAEAVIRAVSDPHVDVRCAAARALGRLRYPGGADPLRRLLRERKLSSQLQEAAKSSLEQIELSQKQEPDRWK
jgi:HEAT repeat protein